MSSDPLTPGDQRIARAHTPTIMVNTPEGTRKPNGITPPRSQSEGVVAGKYEVKAYKPSDYAGVDPGRISPGPTSRPAGMNSSSMMELGGTGGGLGMTAATDAYLQPHDSPSPLAGKGGQQQQPQDPRQKRPGDAASFYGGTPPTFPPPPGMESVAAAQYTQGYSMSGALPTGVSTYPLHGGSGPGAGVDADLGAGSTASMSGPAAFMGPSTMGRERGLRAARVDTESALREYLDLQRRVRLGASMEDKERLKRLATKALNEVKELRKELGTLVKKKEGGRIGRFIVGGIVAGTIPIIKRFFRRPSDSPASKTEYAYSKSQSMVSRILSSVHKTGWAASIFMFVLAALYVFQAEVMIRVAKTMHKRLKRLVIKMEEGERLGRDGMVVMEDSDLNVLRGWRWRVLLWSK